jgi:transposase
MPEILQDADNGLPGMMRHLLERLTKRLKELDEGVGTLEQEIQRVAP